MDVFELRIGNYVNVPKDGQCPFRIDLFDYVANGIGKFGMIYDKSVHPLTWYLQDLKPIPLTKEWLFKFGFGQSEDHEVGHNTSNIVDFYYDYHFKRFRVETQEGEEIRLPNIQYIHQLQNLYFALTGTELVLKSAGEKI